MTSTPIFDALAAELETAEQDSGEVPAQQGRSADQEGQLSGRLD